MFLKIYFQACSNDDGGSIDCCIAGDQALLTLTGTFEPDTIHAGHVIVRGGEVCLPIFNFKKTIDTGHSNSWKTIFSTTSSF